MNRNRCPETAERLLPKRVKKQRHEDIPRPAALPILHVLQFDSCTCKVESAKPNRKAEAKLQFERGLGLIGIDYNAVRACEDTSYILGCIGYLGDQADDNDLLRNHVSVGEWERRISNSDNAIEAFESALFLDPNNEDARLCLALCLDSRRKQEDDARCVPMYETLMKGAKDEKIRYVAGLLLWREDEVQMSPELTRTVNTYGNLAGKSFFCKKFLRKGRMTVTKAASVHRRFFLSCVEQIDASTKEGKIPDPKALAKLIHDDAYFCMCRIEELSDNEVEKAIGEATQRFPRGTEYVLLHYYLMDGRRSEPAAKFLGEHVDALTKGSLTHMNRDHVLQSLADDAQDGMLARLYPELAAKVCRILDSEGKDTKSIKHNLIEEYEQRGEKDKVASLVKALGETETPAEKKRKNDIKEEESRWGEHHFGMGAPLYSFAGPIITAAQDKNGHLAIITAPFHIYLVTPGKTDAREISVPKGISPDGTLVKTVAMNREKIWVGTTEGLVEIDRATNTHRLYQQKEGLLTVRVNCIALVGDRLWIGLERDSGYLDLKTSNFVVVKEMNVVKGMDEVSCMTPGVDGNLWFSCGHIQTDNMKLTSIPFLAPYTEKGLAQTSCDGIHTMAANARYVVVGSFEIPHDNFNAGGGGISCYDIEQKRLREIPCGLLGARAAERKKVIPHPELVPCRLLSEGLASVAIIDSTAWAIGITWDSSQGPEGGICGYIALVDVIRDQLISTCKLDIEPVFKDFYASRFDPQSRPAGAVLAAAAAQGVWVGLGRRLYFINDTQSPLPRNRNGETKALPPTQGNTRSPGASVTTNNLGKVGGR